MTTRPWRLFTLAAAMLATCGWSESRAQSWYWVNYGGATWNDAALNWLDSEGNSPAGYEPGGGSSAFIVLPYPFGGEQPVQVFYRSDTQPLLRQVVLESGNVLYQSITSFANEAQLHLRSNVEIVGGSGLTFVPPPNQPPMAPEIFPKGSHIQTAGSNSLSGTLIVAGTQGSEGLYRLGGTGILSVEHIEHLGQAGGGSFEQNSGTHWVGTALFMGYEATGAGRYRMTGGSLAVDGTVVVGSAGTGLFEQLGGTHQAGQLLVGLETGGSGTYQLGGLAELNVSGTITVGKQGQGTFEQTGGTHNAANLTMAPESGSSGTYSLSQTGTLNVADSLVMDASGVASFVQNGGVANVGSVFQSGQMTIGGFSGKYTLNGGLLNVIGQSTIRQNGSFTQTGGEFRTTLLTLRGGVTHNMEGGTLNVSQWDVDGYVHQTSGDATVGSNFTVGPFLYLTPELPRRYILEDTGTVPAPSLKVNGIGIIGNGHVGIFTQRGTDSLAIFNNLIVGGGNVTIPLGYIGTYELENGALEVNGQATIGSTSSGHFNQTGGKSYVNGDMVVGDQSIGRYSLQNAVLDVDANMTVGRFGQGTVLNSAGKHTVGGDLLLGAEDGGTGEYSIRDMGVLEVRGNEVIGAARGSSTFDHNLGLNWVARNLTIENSSSYRQSDGITHVGENLIVSASSRYSLTNAAKLEVESNALFNGTLRNDSIFTVGGNLTLGEGDLNDNAILTVTGDLDSSLYSSGVFIQRGGVHTVHGNAQVNGYDQASGDFLIDGNLDSGRYSLSGGLLTSATHDAARFVQSGGVHIVSAEMSISGSSVGGIATVGGTGSLTAGNIVNYGTFRLEGVASVTAAGGIHNTGWGSTFTIAGAGQKKTIDAELTNGPGTRTEVSTTLVEFRKSISNEADTLSRAVFSINASGVDFHGPVTNHISWSSVYAERKAEFLIDDSVVAFHDSFTNYGRLQVTNSEARFLAGLDNHGTYVTDPSDNHFAWFTVHEHGVIQAGAGDRFIIEGDFINMSEEGALWDTGQSLLRFENGPTHDVILAGADLGPSFEGFSENFAWGILEIAPGQSLAFSDGNSTPGAALYVGELDGVVISDGVVSNINGNGFNLYYDPTLSSNAYLAGMSYALADGGVLAVAVPEPGTWAMLLAGLGVVAWRRKPARV